MGSISRHDGLHWGASLIGMAMIILMASGCPRRETGRDGASALEGRTDRSQVLLANAIHQLGDLPSYVDTDLAPPQVVLDARTSSDKQDVLAVVGPQPTQGDGPSIYNVLYVPQENSQFRALGVKTGDIVKYFIDIDDSALVTEEKVFGASASSSSSEADDAETDTMWSEGFVREKSIDLTVGQVLDDSRIILATPLTGPVEVPAKIEVWRFSDERMLEIGRRLGRYVNSGRPLLAWQPSPDERVLVQILDRLNPWLRQCQPIDGWQADELLETLPESLLNDDRLQPHISADALARLSFELHEVRLLQQRIWLRDISEWARGESFDPLRRATALFDWTIRNIQLDSDESHRSRWPWEILMYGRGTAEQRAWIFALLCRQQKLDVVVLTVPDDSKESQRFWLPAVFLENSLYLFDTRLGLPIRGPDGEHVATLRELQNDPQLLADLIVGDLNYDVSAEQIAEVVANVVASPLELTQRAKLLEGELTGDDRLILSLDPSDLASRVKQGTGVKRVQLWDLPYRTLRIKLRWNETWCRREAAAFLPFAWRPTLWKARVLHFQGLNEIRKDLSRGGLEEQIDSHRDAVQFYTSPAVRPPERLLSTVESPDKLSIYTTVKQCASYWLGLLSFDAGRYDAAVDWFLERTLKDSPDGPWTGGARYNLARAYEELGQVKEAISLYRRDDSPQRHGNLVRARLLEKQEGEQERASE